MNERRALDATQIRNILLEVTGSYGDVRQQQSDITIMTGSLRVGDFPDLDIRINTSVIRILAEQLRVLTVFEGAADPAVFAGLLAHIALVAHLAAPKICGLPIDAKETMPVAHRLCAEFAMACVNSYARFHQYTLDETKISPDEISIALLMNDDQLLTSIYSKSLTTSPTARSQGSKACRTEGQHDLQLNAASRELEGRIANAYRTPSLPPTGTDRQLSARDYWTLRAFAELESCSAYDILKAIEEYFSPTLDPECAGRHARRAGSRYGSEPQDLEATFRYFESQFANPSPVKPDSAKAGEDHQLSATSFWNLRSIAEVESWSAQVMLILMDEHLSPTLEADLIHHSKIVSGTDWRRLYDFVSRRYRNVLWTSSIASPRG